jgi:hypothetical protein
MRDGGDRRRGRDHRADDEARHRRPVALQFADRQIEGRIDEDGREKQRQREFRIELDARYPRREGQRGSDQRKEGRIGRADATRQGRERERQRENAEKRFEQEQGAPPGLASCPN